jgi:hypothetical protein
MATLTSTGMGDDDWLTVAAALAAAYKTLPGSHQNVRVTVPPESDELRILACEAPGAPEVDVTPPDDVVPRRCQNIPTSDDAATSPLVNDDPALDEAGSSLPCSGCAGAMATMHARLSW